MAVAVIGGGGDDKGFDVWVFIEGFGQLNHVKILGYSHFGVKAGRYVSGCEIQKHRCVGHRAVGVAVAQKLAAFAAHESQGSLYALGGSAGQKDTGFGAVVKGGLYLGFLYDVVFIAVEVTGAWNFSQVYRKSAVQKGAHGFSLVSRHVKTASAVLRNFCQFII